MTDKELHKLGRRDLLQLMLAQGREAERAKKELAEAQDKLAQLEAGYERLKRRLDEKDAMILKLRSSLKNVWGPGPEMELPLTFVAPPGVSVQEAVPVAQEPSVVQITPLPQAPPVAQPAPGVQHIPAPVVEPLQVPKESKSSQQQAQAEAPGKPEQSREKPSVYGPATRNGMLPAKPADREQQFYDYLFGPVVEREQPEARSQPAQVDPSPAAQAASQDEQAQPSGVASESAPQNEQIPAQVPAQPFPVYGEHIPVYEGAPVPLGYPQRIYAAPQSGYYYYAVPAGEARPYYPGPGQLEPVQYQPPVAWQEAAGGEPIDSQQPELPERYGYSFNASAAQETQPEDLSLSQDEFLPKQEPEENPEGTQELSAIEFVNGEAVSQS